MSAITTEELRVKADELGIKYTAKTSDDTLLAKIEKAEKEKEKEQQIIVKKEETKNKLLKRRVRVIPLNPNELHMQAKYFMLMNSTSQERVAVPFNKPWFLSEQMIKHIKSQQYLYVPSNIDVRHNSGLGDSQSEEVRKELKPAYTVEELGPITKEEFDNMRKDKQLRDAANQAN